MSVSRYFAADRETARAQFAAACDNAGLRVVPYHPPPEVATRGEPIVEVARLGAPQAAFVVALTCGTWEDEGLCASGIQTSLLREKFDRQLPADSALLLVHAIAPSGLSGLGSRTPEWDAQMPREWSHKALAAAEHRFANYVQKAIPSIEPKPGESVPWQARLLCQIADTFFQGARHIALIDLRTGPGMYGEVDLLACSTATDPSLQRAASLFLSENDLKAPPPRGAPGDLANGLIAALARSELTAAVLEFGTYSMRSVLAPGTGKVFYPSTADWREQVWSRTRAVVERTLSRLHNLAD